MRLLRAVAWVALVLLGSVAAAGLVVSLDHPASGDARPELTARDAAVLAPRLAVLDVPLGHLAAAARALSGAGRDVLVQLRAEDLPAVTAALDRGHGMLGTLAGAGDEVRADSRGLLDGLGDGRHLPATDRARVVAITGSAAASVALARAWTDVTAAAAAPAAVLRAVLAHEDAVDAATAAGRDARYPDALAQLEVADAALADAHGATDEAVASGHDGSSVDAWLSALGDHDAALRGLYAQLVTSRGVRTPAVDAALAAVSTAQAVLPATGDALGGAVMDLGASDITPALLTMEEIRGTIEAALPGAGG